MTSAEFAKELADTDLEFELCEAQYQVATDIDGSIQWSRISSFEVIGSLYQAGQAMPLKALDLQARRAEKRRGNDIKRLHGSDPLEPGQPTMKSNKGTASGRGRCNNRNARGTASGGGSGSSAAAQPVEDVEAYPILDDLQVVEPLALHDRQRPDGDAMDMADLESEGHVDSDLDEFALVYEEDPHGHGADQHEGDHALGVGDESATLEPGISHALGASTLGAGLGPGEAEDAGAVPSEPPSAQLAPLEQRWREITDPSALGYMYFGGRSVLRLQVGKPKGSATINCYAHPGCSALVPIGRCPSLDALKKWYFEVPRPEADASKARRKQLATEHMAIARSRWTASGAAASSRG